MDILFNRTELGDRKPSKILSEMRQLLEAYDADNTQFNAVLKKLFLDKLPKQARTILAANLERNLDLLGLRADELVAALFKRLSEPERSEFNPLHENTSSRADSATAGFKHCSQSFNLHSAVTEQNETDLSPPEERFNVKLKSTNTNIGQTNSDLKSQLLNREASSASAVQKSKIEPYIKHGPTPLSPNKKQNTVETKQVSAETQTESLRF